LNSSGTGVYVRAAGGGPRQHSNKVYRAELCAFLSSSELVRRGK
jgi:hypothetical protein